MTRTEALALLRLTETSGPEDIEQAYQRLVRRYPPEFHPEKFRQIDAAYTFLRSLPSRLEHFLLPQKFQAGPSGDFPFHLAPPPSCAPQDILAAFQQQLLFSHLWDATPKTAGQRRNPGKPSEELA